MEWGLPNIVQGVPAFAFTAAASSAGSLAAADFPDMASAAGAQASSAQAPAQDPDIMQQRSLAKVKMNEFSNECHTCKNRKYQDGSNDPGVSFKSAAHISPENSASVVIGHEMEHVSHEQANAKLEGAKVVQQYVILHNSVCPECGRPYVAGGETTTVTRKPIDANALAQQFDVGKPTSGAAAVNAAV